MANLLKLWFGLFLLSSIMISYHSWDLMSNTKDDLPILNISIEDRVSFQNDNNEEKFPCLIAKKNKEIFQSCDHFPCQQGELPNSGTPQPISFIQP